MTLNCIIVDDEPLALDILEDYIRRTPALKLAHRLTNGAEALKVLGKGDIDLAFLDIQMPGLSGLEVARAVDSSKTRVIFTTAFEQYALDGFRVDALDYLLKPVSFNEFTRAIEKADRSRGRIVVQSDHRHVALSLDAIVYIESKGDYVSIHTADGAVIQTLMTLKGILALLPPSHFVRIHRSYVVGIQYITHIERGRAVLGEITLPVSDSYRAALTSFRGR